MVFSGFARLMWMRMLKKGSVPQDSTTATQFNALVDQVNAIADVLFIEGYDLTLVPLVRTRASVKSGSSTYVSNADYEALKARVDAITEVLSEPLAEIMQTESTNEATYPNKVPYTEDDYVSEAEFQSLQEYVAEIENILSDGTSTVLMVAKGE